MSRRRGVQSPQQNNKIHHLLRHTVAAAGHGERFSSERRGVLLTLKASLNLDIAFGIVVGAIRGKKELVGLHYFSLGFFFISTVAAFFAIAATNYRRTTAAIVLISVTASGLGWGFLAYALAVNSGSSSDFTLADLRLFFPASLIGIPMLLLRAVLRCGN